jgi:hypothetical protein
MMRRLSGVLLPAILVAAAVVAVFAPAWTPSRTFAGMDFLNLLYPQGALAKRAFAAGEFPLWNWHTWGGSPLLAAMQSAALYPAMWVLLCLPLPYGLQVFILLHLVWGGLGCATAARRLFSLQTIPATFAGITFACGGFVFGHLEQANSIAAISWTPWILLTTALLDFSWRGVARLGATVALAMTAGHPQYVVLALLFAVAFAAVERGARAWLNRGPACAVPPKPAAAGLAATVCALALAMALAAGLAAAQILPAHELSGLSERVWQYPDPNDPSLRWKFLLAWFTPRFYNRLSNSPGQPLGYSELGLYGGMLAFPLFLVGLAALLRSRQPAGLGLVTAWLLSLLYSLGSHGGVSALAFRLVPLLGASRGAARGLAFEAVAYGIIAGCGMATCVAAAHRRIRGHREALSALLPLGMVLLVVIDLAVTHRAELGHRLTGTALLEMPVATADRFGPPASSAPRIHRFMANDSDLYLDQRGEAVLQRRFRLQPNMNLMDYRRLTDGYEEGLLPPRHYANFLRRFNRNLRNERPDAPLLALMGVGSVFTEYPITDMGALWEADGPAAYYFGTTYRLFRPRGVEAAPWLLAAAPLGPAVRDNWDPAWWGATVSRTPHGGAVREETSRGAPVAHPADWLSSSTIARASAAPVAWVAEMRTNSLTFEGQGEVPERLLFLQSWYPGWKHGIAVRGTMTSPLLPKSPIFSELAWPKGARRLSVAYRPFSFRLGGFITLATLGGVLGWGTLSGFRRRVPA